MDGQKNRKSKKKKWGSALKIKLSWRLLRLFYTGEMTSLIGVQSNFVALPLLVLTFLVLLFTGDGKYA